MKIVVVNGTDSVSSRERYSKIITGVKKKGWDVVMLTKEDKLPLKDQLSNKSLFNDQILFVSENLSKIPTTELNWLKDNIKEVDGSLLIYSNKPVTASQKKQLPSDTKYEDFELPKIIFAFLDSLYPGNVKASLKFLEELFKNEAFELLLAMMARHFRDLYWVSLKDGGPPYPSWRVSKLYSQSKKFTLLELKGIIQALSDLDIKSKSSDINRHLLLEMLLIENL